MQSVRTIYSLYWSHANKAFVLYKYLLFNRGGISINSYSDIKIYNACRNLQANVDNGQLEPYKVCWEHAKRASVLNKHLYKQILFNRGGILINSYSDIKIYNACRNLQANVDSGQLESYTVCWKHAKRASVLNKHSV